MKFEVETASLNSTVNNMNSVLDDMADQSNQLYEALEELDGMWEGAAHDTFAAQYMADQEMLKNMRNTLQRIIQGMNSARTTYDQCEEAVKTEIAKIPI